MVGLSRHLGQAPAVPYAVSIAQLQHSAGRVSNGYAALADTQSAVTAVNLLLLTGTLTTVGRAPGRSAWDCRRSAMRSRPRRTYAWKLALVLARWGSRLTPGCACQASNGGLPCEQARACDSRVRVQFTGGRMCQRWASSLQQTCAANHACLGLSAGNSQIGARSNK